MNLSKIISYNGKHRVLSHLNAARTVLPQIRTVQIYRTFKHESKRLTDPIDSALTTSYGDRDPRTYHQDYSFTNIEYDAIVVESFEKRNIDLMSNIYKCNITILRLYENYLHSKLRQDPLIGIFNQFYSNLNNLNNFIVIKTNAFKLLLNITAYMIACETILLDLHSETEQTVYYWRNALYMEQMKKKLQDIDETEVYFVKEFEENLNDIMMIFKGNFYFFPINFKLILN